MSEKPDGPGALYCPSAQPDMEDAFIFGVIDHDGPTPQVAYLTERLAITDDVLNATKPLPATRLLRFGARCEESKCVHFGDGRCSLAGRVTEMLGVAAEALPACVLRKDCRWYHQEGRPACLRCPQIVTQNDPGEEIARVAGLPADQATRSAT